VQLREAGILRVVSKSEGWEMLKSIEAVLAEREVSAHESSRSNELSRGTPESKSALMH
jgi:hypothetical protein